MVTPETPANPKVLLIDDDAALTAMLRALAEDPARRAHLGALARTRVAETCGTPVVMAQYRRVYEDLLAR